MVEMKALEEEQQGRDNYGRFANDSNQQQSTGHDQGQQQGMGQQGTNNQQMGHQGMRMGIGTGGTIGGDGGGRRNHSKRDIIDSLCTSVNQDLLVSKTFYFFFFSAFGSLFPLMAVYFKQLGMNPTQSGMLIGFRPFVEFVSAPFWGSLADRYRKGKIMLIFSLFSWIVFTLSLAFIQPPASSCVHFNTTHHVLYTPNSDRSKRSVIQITPLQEEEYDKDEVMEFNFTDEKWPENDIVDFSEATVKPKHKRDKRNNRPSTYLDGKSPSTVDYTDEFNSTNEKSPDKDIIVDFSEATVKRKHKRDDRKKLPSTYVVGKSPNTVEYTLNYNQEQHTNYVSPSFSSMVYKWDDVQEVFFLLLLLVLLGEFFSAPAITLADSVTLTYLGENMDNYGKQRMFGSLGWGLAMFFVGIALDHSTSFTDHPCGPHDKERNYTICFATFSVLMGCALMASTQFRFDYDVGPEDNIALKFVENGPQTNQHSPGLVLSAGGGGIYATGGNPTEEPPVSGKSTVFAQTTRALPEWFSVIRTFATVRYAAFLYVTWFMGFGIGLVFTFLFWHLQDLGGTPTLFGVASVINHISEIFAYFFSFKFIKQIGHVKVLCIGLVGNICRFLYISWLRNPWWVLPFELIQGVTHAAVWAACCSYITQATPSNLRSSAQGVLQGLHHGLGRGCGAIIGGIFVNYFGTQITFRGYGFACLIVLILFVFINYYQRDRGFASFHDENEPDNVVEESSHLAPHGVPSNPMAKSLSRQNLQHQQPQQYEGDQTGYGTVGQPASQNAGFLDIPQSGGGYYTGGGAQNYSDLNMNNTIPRSNIQITRGALAAAFNPKGLLAAASSPEAAFEYNFIKRDFKAFDDATNSNHITEEEDDNKESQERVLSAPQPKTNVFNPQPLNRTRGSLYEW